MITQEELSKLLKRDVTPRMVEIWNGIGIPEDKAETFRQLWQRQAGLAKEVQPSAESFQPRPIQRNPCGCKKANPS